MRAVVVAGASRHQPDSDQTSSKGDSRGRRCVRNNVDGDGVGWDSGAKGDSGGWCRGPLLLVCSKSRKARLRLIMYAAGQRGQQAFPVIWNDYVRHVDGWPVASLRRLQGLHRCPGPLITAGTI
jgi:hypothetical protein